jgi:hypothetical protein
MAMTEPDFGEYVTDNVPLVAWLCISGHEATDIISGRPNRRGKPYYKWVFNDGTKLQNDIRFFMTGEARVEPNGYATMIRELFNELREVQADSHRRN